MMLNNHPLVERHKSNDYKISAVKYYNSNNKSMDEVCEIFDCKKSSLKRWIDRYNSEDNVDRQNRTPISYKVKKEHVDYSLNILKQNEQITMNNLNKVVKEKYNDFDISSQHLGQVILDNNRTRKRTRHEHFPSLRYNQPVDKQSELAKFYREVRKYPLDKIICLDETSISAALKPTYSRCYLGKRCIIKTNNNFVFRNFTLLVAINNSKYLGYEVYDKGMTKEKLKEFLEKYVFSKYKNNLIILDNAGSHNNHL